MRIKLFFLAIFVIAIIPICFAATKSCSGGTNTGTLINCSGSTGRAQINITSDTLLSGATCILNCNISSPRNLTMLNNNIKFNCSGDTKCGITLAAATKATFKLGGNHWSSLNGNNTWIYAPFDAYRNDTNVNVIIENNTFSGLGEWPGTTDYMKGIFLKSCGIKSRINNNTVFNSSHFVYVDNGNALAGGSSACIVNITNNHVYLIRHTFVTLLAGIKNEYFVANNSVTGIWDGVVVTNNNAGMFHYSQNTIGTTIADNEASAAGYVTDFVGPDKNGVIKRNYWHDSRMGDDLNKNCTGFTITNSTYRNIRDDGLYIYHGSLAANHTIANLQMYNITGAGQGYCIWLASGASNYIGGQQAPRNITFTNILCSNVNVCIRNANATNITYSRINCSDALSSSAATFDLGTKHVLVTKSNFTRSTGYSLNIGSGVNMTINATNFFDWNVTSASALAKWSANYYSNDTTPDADHNGIVDHTHVIPGLGSDFDLVPRANYYGYVASSSALPSTDPNLDSLCTRGFGSLIFLLVFIMALAGGAIVLMLNKGSFDTSSLVMTAGAGILVVITVGVVVAQLCS